MNIYKPASELSNEQYHASEGISKSGLDLINKTPGHYFARYLDPNREPVKQTHALVFGSAFHTILEDEKLFRSQFVEGIQVDRRTTKGKQAAADFEAAAEGKTVLSPEDWAGVHRMRDKLMSRQGMRTLMEGGLEAEPTYFFDHFANSTDSVVQARVRPDAIAKSRDFIIDFKTTVSARREDFEKSCANFRYHVQAAMYLTGASLVTAAPINTFFFVAIEKEPPYAVQIFEAPHDFVQRGYEAFQRNIDTYAQCVKQNQWPDYPDEITTLNLPKWTPL